MILGPWSEHLKPICLSKEAFEALGFEHPKPRNPLQEACEALRSKQVVFSADSLVVLLVRSHALRPVGCSRCPWLRPTIAVARGFRQ